MQWWRPPGGPNLRANLQKTQDIIVNNLCFESISFSVKSQNALLCNSLNISESSSSIGSSPPSAIHNIHFALYHESETNQLTLGQVLRKVKGIVTPHMSFTSQFKLALVSCVIILILPQTLMGEKYLYCIPQEPKNCS